MAKLKWIDAVRGYAIIGVLFVHALYDDQNIIGKQIWSLGAKGVQLFYIASAFTLLLSHDNRKQENNSTLDFYLRRIFRIAPMFWLGIIYYLWQDKNEVYLMSDKRYITNLSILSHFFLLHGLSPYWLNNIVPGGWSVGVECTFYLLCPLLFYVIKDKKSAIYFYVFSLVISFITSSLMLKLSFIPYKIMWVHYTYGFLLGQLHVFSMGFLLYFYINDEWKNILKTFIPLLIFGSLLVCFNFTHEFESGQEVNFFVSIFFFVIIVYLSRVRGVKHNLLVNKIIVFLGKISYSFYLVHFAVLYWIEKIGLRNISDNLNLNYFSRLLIVGIVTTVISTLTYNYIEEPIRKIGSKILKNLSGLQTFTFKRNVIR